MKWALYIGLFAAACTTLSYIPQAVKIIKTRHTKDISLGMYVILEMGIASWLTYGILIQDPPIIVANVITLIFTTTILGLKLKYK